MNTADLQVPTLEEAIALLPDDLLREEAELAAAFVLAALAEGYSLGVFDSAEWSVRNSTDAAEVLGGLAHTEEDTTRVRTRDGSRIGDVWLIWGNGQDVFTDWTDRPAINALVEPLLDGVA